jgi:hypothetical protein
MKYFCDDRRGETDLVRRGTSRSNCLSFRSSYGFHSRRTTLCCDGRLLSSRVQSRSGRFIFDVSARILGESVAYRLRELLSVGDMTERVEVVFVSDADMW